MNRIKPLFINSDLPTLDRTNPNDYKSILISFLTLLCCLHLLFNHVPAHAENKNATNILIPKIKAKIKQYPSLICGIYVKPSWMKGPNSSININGDTTFPAASLIKIPVAVALLLEIDKGKISWDKTLILKRYHYAVGAGCLRTKKVGTKLKLKEVFRLMLTISDNTATNMVIDLLGGIEATNQKIAKLDLRNTRLVNWLGDFKGTNKTSPRDLVDILDRALEGNLLSNSSRKTFKRFLVGVNNKSLIKKGLPRYTKFAHKTGTIGICVGDAGIIYLPWGKKIGIAIIVRRPFNSFQGQKIIREISRLVYNDLF